ncbi:MAG: flavin reductase family protein [Bacteroidales bacterium]|nr:flavin reductase family protein [Bacteroidales bacterium]
MKKVLATIAAMAMLIACQNKQTEPEAAAADTFVSDGTWHKITPEEIPGNAVSTIRQAMLLTAGHEGDLNTMTIGWGQLGVLWQRPVVTVYVSTSRYTYEFMERNEYFTVTGFPQELTGSVMYMGQHSGRDGDKIAEGGLHTEFTELGNPIFTEANLAIECKKLYTAELDTARAPENVKAMYQHNGPHVMYIGEIVNVMRK